MGTRRNRIDAIDRPLSPAEVGAMLGLHPKTVSRYAEAGAIPFMILPSGHRRFHKADVEAILAKGLTR